jgi:hypothetical protein
MEQLSPAVEAAQAGLLPLTQLMGPPSGFTEAAAAHMAAAQAVGAEEIQACVEV